MGYLDSMAHYYDMSTPVALHDLGIPGGNDGTGANIASNPEGMPGGRCAEFNGTDSMYDLADVVELNAVSAFTIAFWMRQDVLDQTDIIFRKFDDGTHDVTIYTSIGGDMLLRVRNGTNSNGIFDYSAVISAGTWHHVAMVFDGSQATDATRLIAYVDGAPITLAFAVAIPATTADLTGIDATIGHSSSSFDGRLDSLAIFSRALTQLQVADHMLATRQGRI